MIAATWSRLATEHPRGRMVAEALGFARAIASGRLRFAPDGSCATPLYSASGAIVGVLAFRGLRGPWRGRWLEGSRPGGTFANSIGSIVGGRDIVITVGARDALTAHTMWPAATVIGALDARGLADVVARVARRARLARAALYVLTPPTWIASEDVVCAVARHAGLKAGRNLFIVAAYAGAHRSLHAARRARPADRAWQSPRALWERSIGRPPPARARQPRRIS